MLGISRAWRWIADPPSIFARIFVVVALMSAAPLAITVLVVVLRSQDVQTELVEQSSDVAEQTSRDSEHALERQARDTYLQIVREKAAQLESFFENIRRAVLLGSALVTQCLRSQPVLDPPPLYTGNEVGRWLRDDPDGTFAREQHADEPYCTWHPAPGVDTAAVQPLLKRLRPLGYFFAHNQRSLPWCDTTYVGLPERVIFGYPGGKARPGRDVYPESYDPTQRPWYRRADESRSLVWTDIYLDRNGTDMVITCANPVEDSGELRAVMAVDVELTQIITNLFDLRDLPVSDAVLVDEQARVRIRAVYSDEGVELTRTAEVEAPLVADFDAAGFGTVHARVAGAAAANGIIAPTDLPDTRDAAMYAWARIVIRGGQGQPDEARRWTYIVKMPRQLIVGPVQAIRRAVAATHAELNDGIEAVVQDLGFRILLITAGVLAGALLVALLAARSHARPLRQIARAATAIGAGNLDQQVSATTRDEVGQLGAAINRMIKGLKERDLVTDTFKRYVNPGVVELLIKDPGRIRLGGERRSLTIFFSDLAGFTGIGEQMTPEALVVHVNQYLDAMTRAIHETGGTLDKYLGDAVMAFWGAPVEQKDHAVRACRSALMQQAALRELVARWKADGLPELEMRIGINTGPVVVGNVGSATQMGYTVMGDAVNLTSRLEGANKFYGTRILIGEGTRQAAGDAIAVREVDRVTVKGRQQAVSIYELRFMARAWSEADCHACRVYEEGLAHMRAREWDTARRGFERAIDAFGGSDPVSEVMLDRLETLQARPPGPDWDGEFSLKWK